MTANQTNQLVKNPNTKKAMAVLAKYAELESSLKNAKKEAEEATELIKNAMIEAGVPKIEIELPNLTGYITLAERTNYSAEDIDSVPEQYTKLALDTTKVKAQHTLTGQLPVGVVESKTQYITKKFKAVA
ncbi:MAG: hypothetical protein V4563_18180 [Pseudomonadota bacterium]